MTRSEFNQRMAEYLETIETEKDGEEMRDTITKTLITIDMFNAGIFVYPIIVQFKETLGDALDLMWEDISSFYPNAVRPALPSVDPATVMPDELEDILKRLMNSTVGSDIRSAFAAGCRNVYESVVNHNFDALYHLKAVEDMFVAFIEACDDEEKRTAALATREQWYITSLIKAYNLMYDNVEQPLMRLIDTSTGATARPLLLSTLTDIRAIINNEFANTDSSVWIGYEYVMYGQDLEMVANILIDPNWFSDYRYNISAGGPYATQGEAEARYESVAAIDTRNNYDVVDLFDDERRGFYVILNYNTTDDGWYMTYAGAYARATTENDRHPALNLVVIDSPYKEVTNNG